MTEPPGQTISLDGHRIELTSLDKVLFPASGLTKGDLVDYYRRIADVALPYYRDRPLTMQRFPDGIGAEGFFQKDLPDHFPDWIDRVELEKKDGTVTYLIANNAAALVYVANQACVTPHLALSRRCRPHYPDRLIFDLDPSDEDFAKVRDAALMLKTQLDALGLASFVQTTGSRGLHVVVPLDRSAKFSTVRALARDIAEALIAECPDLLTTEQRKTGRGDRVFVDYLRNAYGQTSVAPYAVRASENAPVATPLDWQEVPSPSLDPQKYTIDNIFRRLGQMSDPWTGMGRAARPLSDASRALARRD